MARLARWAWLGLVVAAIVRPFFLSTWYGNDEIDRYPGRLELLYRHASLTEPLPRWIPELAGGHGYPLFDFFNPGAMFIAMPFRALGLDPFLATKLALIVMLAVGALHAAWLAERLFGWAASILAGTLYLLAPYTLANLYHRGDLAELWATMLFPAVAYHALALYESRRPLHFFALAAAWAALVPAHAFSALLFAISFAIGWLLALRRLPSASPERRRGLALVTLASVLGVAMAAIYWLPALAEKSSVHIDSFFSVERLMSSALSGDDLVDPTPEGRIAAPRRLTLGLWIPVLLVTSVVLVLARRHVPRRGLTVGLLFAVSFCLYMTTPAAEPVYAVVPLIGQILFPYRFLGIGTLLAVLAASRAPALLKHTTTISVASCVATLVLALPYLVVLNPVDFPPGHADFAGRAQRELVFFDYGEYFPREALDEPLFFEALPYRAEGGCHVERASIAGREHDLTVGASAPCRVTLRQMRWLGWHATLDGASIAIDHDRSGRMVLAVPRGSHRLRVFWEPTGVQRAATIASWIAFGVFLVLGVAVLRRRESRERVRALLTRGRTGAVHLRNWLTARTLSRAGFAELACARLGSPASRFADPVARAIDAVERTRPRSLRGELAGAGMLAVLVLAGVVALWPRPRSVAHTDSFLGGDPTFGAERAIDGMRTTQWLEHDFSPGHLEVTLVPRRIVREIELVNAFDLDATPRGTERYRLEVLDGERVVLTRDGTLAREGRATIAVGGEADRIRFTPLSRRGSSAGLTELLVR